MDGLVNLNVPHAGSTDAIPRARSAPLPVVLRLPGARGSVREVRLGDGRLLLGTSPEADVVLDDPTVSRLHAELSLVPEGLFVRDLGSLNAPITSAIA